MFSMLNEANWDETLILLKKKEYIKYITKGNVFLFISSYHNKTHILINYITPEEIALTNNTMIMFGTDRFHSRLKDYPT